MMLLNISKSTSRSLYIGFVATVFLIVVLAGTAMIVTDQARQRIESRVMQNQQKHLLLSELRTVARERVISMEKLLLLADPININEEWIHFNDLVSRYRKLRYDLEQHLDIEELAEFKKYFTMISGEREIQMQISELIFYGEYNKARQYLLTRILPDQDNILNIIDNQRQKFDLTSLKSLEEARQTYYTTINWLTGSAILALLIAIYVISIIARRLTRAEQLVVQEKERALTALHSIGDAVITTDAGGNIERINKAAEILIGGRIKKVKNLPIDAVLPIIDEETRHNIHPAQQTLETGETFTLTQGAVLILHSGEECAVQFTASPIHDENKNISGMVLVIKDISEMRALAYELERQVRQDSLTGLINRRELESQLEQTVAEARRYPEEHAWFCYLDLDQFKIINDTCGHLAGDELLKQIAYHLINATRETDHVARMGGDEFTIILKRCKESMAYTIMDRVRELLQQAHFCWDNKCFNVSASIGIVPITAQSGTVYDLLKAADTACYIAKEEGRNRIHMYGDSDKRATQRQGEMEWVHRIHNAIETGRFVLFFQEILPLRHHEPYIHGEVLIRMLDENGNIIAPYSFIPAAERYNIMSEVDKYIIKQALDSFNHYAHHPFMRKSMFSINLSAQSLSDNSCLEFVLSELSSSKIQPQNICFEITETAAISNLTRATNFIKTLKKQGCLFALDDFGSGLSSFAYLKNLPVDFIKIDGVFVKDMLRDSMNYTMVSAVNQIGHVAGIKTIAEFVENEVLKNILSEMGVDYAQGYGIGQPEPLETLLIRAHANMEGEQAIPRELTG